MNTTVTRTTVVASAAGPITGVRHSSATRMFARIRHGRSLVHVIAATVAATMLLFGAAVPAEAASYRDIRSVRYGSCLYVYGDPLEDIYLRGCATTPAANGNWKVVPVGSYNRHPLWVLMRQGGTCFGTRGTRSSYYLYSTCDSSLDQWEVFTTSNGHLVLKSLSAYLNWGIHTCLTFDGRLGGRRPQLGACSLTSTLDQIYK